MPWPRLLSKHVTSWYDQQGHRSELEWRLSDLRRQPVYSPLAAEPPSLVDSSCLRVTQALGPQGYGSNSPHQTLFFLVTKSWFVTTQHSPFALGQSSHHPSPRWPRRWLGLGCLAGWHRILWWCTYSGYSSVVKKSSFRVWRGEEEGSQNVLLWNTHASCNSFIQIFIDPVVWVSHLARCWRGWSNHTDRV